MKGIEVSQAYFAEYGMPMLQGQFPDVLPHVAAGLFGSGSECFGYDDGLSRAEQHVGNVAVICRYPCVDIAEKDDHVGGLNGDLRLHAHVL